MRRYNTAYDKAKRRVGGSGFAKKAAANAVWRKSQKGIAAARKGNATRAARKRGASISIGEEEQRLIRWIYAHCPAGHEVDHIVPLSNGGSHDPDNLQYLPMTINRQKSSRADYDAAAHAIRWQDLLETPSTIIPRGSRGKRPEARQAP